MKLNRSATTALTLTLFFILPLTALAMAGGTTEGELIVNGESSKLIHAYAIAQPDFFDESEENIVVILTDTPLSNDAIEDEFERMQMESDGTLKCVELTLNSQNESVSVRVRHIAFDGGPSGSGNEEFEVVAVDENSIEGRLYTTGEADFFGTTYEYNVAFKANIHRKVPPTPPTPEEMKAAENSPQAEAYRAFTKAIMTADLETLKGLVTPEMREQLNQPEAMGMIGFLQMMMPTKVEFLRISVEGNSATLEMSAEQDGELATGSTEFMFDGEQWKVGESSWKS